MIGRSPASPGSADRGAALVVAVLLVPVLVAVATGGAALGAMGLLRARAAAVADVAALAAAQSVTDPCTAAAQAAAQNGMRLAGCMTDGADTVLEVTAPAPPALVRLLALLGRPEPIVTARARAGPPAG